MKLLSYEAHNVMRVSNIRFDLEGCHLFLVGGKNAQGKTSALTALLAALCGKSGMDYPEVLLKDGEEEGWVKVQLTGDEDLHEPSGLTVELLLKRKRGGAVVEQFRILDSAGEEAPEPRTLLKRLYELRAFDPLEFRQCGKKERKAVLEKLLGLDFSKENEEVKRLYEQRTVVNREVVKRQSNLTSCQVHKDAPEKEVSTLELMSELEKAQEHNRAIKEAEVEAKATTARIEQAVLQRDAIKDQIEALRRKSEEMKEQIKALAEKEDRQKLALDEMESIDESEIRQKIKDSESINRKVRDNRKYAELKKAFKEVEAEAEELSEKIKTLRSEQERKIREAKFPVPGMGMDEEGVLLNGLPFEQASGKEQLLASVEVGMALNPKLRLMVCQDASRLDEEAIEALDAKLKEHDFQMIAELVTRSQQDDDRCSVVISNGKVKRKEE